MVPSGATVLAAGDELALIGRSADIDAVRARASTVEGPGDGSGPPDAGPDPGPPVVERGSPAS